MYKFTVVAVLVFLGACAGETAEPVARQSMDAVFELSAPDGCAELPDVRDLRDLCDDWGGPRASAEAGGFFAMYCQDDGAVVQIDAEGSGAFVTDTCNYKISAR